MPGNVLQGSGASLFARAMGLRVQGREMETEMGMGQVFMDADRALEPQTWLNGDRGKLHVNTTCNVNTLTAAARCLNQQCDDDAIQHPAFNLRH